MEYRIQIRIDRETAVGRFQDAIYFDPVEFDKLGESDLEALVQARIDNYVANFPTEPVEPVEPLKEDLEKDKANIEELKATLEEQLRLLNEKIQDKENEVPIVEDNIEI